MDTLPKTKTFVPAHPTRRLDVDAQAILGAPLAPSEPGQVDMVTPAYLAHPGADERTTATDRARGLVLRSLPLLGLQLLLSVALTGLAALTIWQAPDLALAALTALLLFAAMATATYLVLDRQERLFSRNGVERHRVDAATRIALAKLNHEARLRREALAQYVKLLENRE